jgi:TatD DNase family protein
MVDAHCHIDLYPNPLEIAIECERLGIYTICVTNLPSHFIQGKRHLQNFKRVRIAIGMHPLYTARHSQEYDLFNEFLEQTSYVGEIGLDFSKEGVATKTEQIKCFEFVLGHVANKSKILSLHSRGAEKEVLNYLCEFDISSAIFHWYSGPISLINEIVTGGFMFSVNSAMTKSKKGQEIIKNIPLSHLLTESDGPFIKVGNKIGKPSDLEGVEDAISKIHKVQRSIVTESISNNFKQLIKSISS